MDRFCGSRGVKGLASLVPHGAFLCWFFGLTFVPAPRSTSFGQESSRRVTLVESARTTLAEGPVKPLGNGVSALAYSPNGSALAVGMHDPDLVLLLDPGTLAVRGRFEGHLGLVSRVAFLPDGQSLVSAGHDGSVRVWDVATRRQRLLLDRFQGYVRAMAISPDGKRIFTGELVSSTRGVAQAWDVQTGQLLGTLGDYDHGIAEIAVSPDGLAVATSSRDRTVRLWDSVNYRQKSMFDGETHWANELMFTPDGQSLVTAFDDRSIRLLEPATLTLKSQFQTRARVSQFLTLAPDGTTLAASDVDRIRVHRLPDGEALAASPELPARIAAIRFAPDGRSIAVGGSGGFVRVYRLETAPN